VGHVGAHALVDADRAAFGELHAGVLEAEVLDVGREADGHEHAATSSEPGSPLEPV